MGLATTAMALENDTRVFKIYPEIKVEKAHFHNRFGIDLTGDLYKPADFDASKKYAAIAVAGPFEAYTHKRWPSSVMLH